MKQAVFDHVDDDGTLILSVDGEKVGLAVTDELEHGILSAQQIRSEEAGSNKPVEPATIPISSIQTQVREGQSIEDIAKSYSIEESLVRRFAQPVETEKHYAIAQFFAVTTKATPSVSKLEDVIKHNLREAGVDAADVTWEATKEGRNPWKIVARFTRRKQDYKATWMWNLHDNSVVSIDPLAKRLLGENSSAGTLLFGEEPANTSNHSIQAALNGRGPIPPAWLNENGDSTQPSAPNKDSSPKPASQAQNPNDDEDANAPTAAMAAQRAPMSPITPESSRSEQQDPQEKPQAQAPSETAPTDRGAEKSSPEKPQNPEAAVNQGNQQSAPSEHKKNRAAVPSWDDILFGNE